MADLEPIFEQHSLADWQLVAEKSLRSEALHSLEKHTASGLEITPLYTERPAHKANLPTQLLQPWDNRLALIDDEPQKQNSTLLAALQGGISSIELKLQSPQRPSALAHNALPQVLHDVQLDILPVSIKAGSAFVEAANQMQSIWQTRGVAAHDTQAAFNADPIGTLAAYGGAWDKLDNQLIAMTGLAQHCFETLPNVRTICVDVSCYHNAGGSIEQELVSGIATAAIYMQSMIDAGMPAKAAHDALNFQLSCDADTLANVAKLRALKQLWHHLASNMDVAEPALNLVVETSLRMQSTREPWVNHLRNIAAASAAAMSGAQTIIVHPHNRIDETFIDNDIEIGARVARNIPIILAEESRMTFIADPMGGSYAIENLTTQLVEKVWHQLQELEKNGGLVEQLKNGQWQQGIADTQHNRVQRLLQAQDIQVGVNRYTNDAHESKDVDVGVSNPATAASKSGALRTLRDAIAFEASA